jgi:uncharacterized protein (DUF1501 family)
MKNFTHSRRDFFKNLSLLGLGSLISPKLVFSQTPAIIGKKNPVIVFVFLRGAQDGLSLLSPIGEENYFKWRPNIAVAEDKSNALIIDNHFQFHPAMKPLYNQWKNRHLAFITQFGSPDTTRSHFDAQDYFESGTPGEKNTNDGFFNRAITQLKARNNLSGIALQASMPRILKGPVPTLSIASIKDFHPPKSELSKSLGLGFEEMYQLATDKVFRGVGEETFESISTIKAKINDKPKVDYPKSKLSDQLRDIASLIRADLGLSIAVTEMGGWDTHVNQGSASGQLSKRFEELSGALTSFIEDLGENFKQTVIVTCTEFGRTVKENGNKGTDHGHGSVAMILGARVNGGKLYGQWKELKPENLYEERDIHVTTDFRAVMGTILDKHLGIKDLATIFPGFKSNSQDWENLLN